jgi:hypothetical protein
MKQGQDSSPTIASQLRFRIRHYEAPRKSEGAGTENISFCYVLMLFYWAKT